MPGLPKPIQLVGNSEQGVAKQHSRTGVAHDFASFCFSLWLVAVYRAVGAGRFVVAIRTLLQPALGVVQKLSAACAQFPFGLVVVAAVDADHLRHRQLLSGKMLLLHSDPDSGVGDQSSK